MGKKAAKQAAIGVIDGTVKDTRWWSSQLRWMLGATVVILIVSLVVGGQNNMWVYYSIAGGAGFGILFLWASDEYDPSGTKQEEEREKMKEENSAAFF